MYDNKSIIDLMNSVNDLIKEQNKNSLTDQQNYIFKGKLKVNLQIAIEAIMRSGYYDNINPIFENYTTFEGYDTCIMNYNNALLGTDNLRKATLYFTDKLDLTDDEQYNKFKEMVIEPWNKLH